ncbi:hypothetical protein AWB70_06114 [Caballeronia cordobensis]|uniref:Uncharacterized protein n=1 Tax=Caballeronia cordobensis TaxID=1353886 RepID=A0A158J8T1_CABCO|nr:hypothetical protein BRPE67_BCDS02980 [Burkholderia sp. RPE67]SAL65274.1 hypothetical protein AWB70_06114 [Caballeronia cordobensis]
MHSTHNMAGGFIHESWDANASFDIYDNDWLVDIEV